mmetsp:Transcript_14150/g.31712  ORF Transcript_14150/g.31712 Transcript_14150/m.31712 type:complete len:255 (-) Transcript_14150:1177-1941(-)
MGDVFGRRESTGRSVLALERFALEFTVVTAKIGFAQAMGLFGKHTRLFGFLRIVFLDTQATVEAVIVFVTGAVVIFDGALDPAFTVLAGSILGAVASVFLAGVLVFDTFSPKQAHQWGFILTGLGAGLERSVARQSLVVPYAFAVKTRVGASAAAAVLAVEFADILVLAHGTRGAIGALAVIGCSRSIALLSRQDTDSVVFALLSVLRANRFFLFLVVRCFAVAVIAMVTFYALASGVVDTGSTVLADVVVLAE